MPTGISKNLIKKHHHMLVTFDTQKGITSCLRNVLKLLRSPHSLQQMHRGSTYHIVHTNLLSQDTQHKWVSLLYDRPSLAVSTITFLFPGFALKSLHPYYEFTLLSSSSFSHKIKSTKISPYLTRAVMFPPVFAQAGITQCVSFGFPVENLCLLSMWYPILSVSCHIGTPTLDHTVCVWCHILLITETPLSHQADLTARDFQYNRHGYIAYIYILYIYILYIYILYIYILYIYILYILSLLKHHTTTH